MTDFGHGATPVAFPASSRIVRLLSAPRVLVVLLGLNVLVACLVCYGFRHEITGDHYTYLGYVEGLSRGRYSYWYFFPDYIPDTLRNPGYPVFLYALSLISKSVALIQLVQLALYLSAVWLVVRTLKRFAPDPTNGRVAAAVFLLLLLPNVQMAYYAAVVFPEILTTFLVTAYFAVVVFTVPGNWSRAIALGLLTGALFQSRPVFLFFPLVQVGLEWLLRRGQFRVGVALLQLAVYGFTMVPYALWNQRHHGQFKITSLEGGAGVMQTGFWGFRMPGYKEMRTFGNTMGNEPIKFVEPAAVPGYIAQFNREWDEIDRQLLPHQTRQDSLYLTRMRHDYPLLIATRSAPLTKAREALMLRSTLQHIAAEPGYYLKTRIYTFFRLFITGVQLTELAKAHSPAALLKVLYPFLVSAFTFLLALVLVPLALWRRRVGGFAFWLALLLTLYFGAIHVPFSIQARYTTPIRLLFIYSIAVSAAGLLRPHRPAVALPAAG